jgi:hypothetical protein
MPHFNLRPTGIVVQRLNEAGTTSLANRQGLFGIRAADFDDCSLTVCETS